MSRTMSSIRDQQSLRPACAYAQCDQSTAGRLNILGLFTY